MRRHVLPLAAVIACALLVTACSRQTMPTSPERTLHARTATDAATAPLAAQCVEPGGGMVPLRLGNRWQYDYRFAEWAGDSTSGTPVYDFRDTFEDVLECVQVNAGHEYVVDRRTFALSAASPSWIQFRQDHAGLYEWDGDLSQAPPCDSLYGTAVPVVSHRPAEDRAWPAVAAKLGVPANAAAWRDAWSRLEARRAAVSAMARGLAGPPRGGVLPGEIQRLRYPLYPGQAWVIRDDPYFSCRVVGPALLHTPAGRVPCWSLRISSELFGPQDVVRTWWGPLGYAGLDALLHAEVTDENGDVIGTMTARQSEMLTGLSLGHHGRDGGSPLGTPVAGNLQ